MSRSRQRKKARAVPTGAATTSGVPDVHLVAPQQTTGAERSNRALLAAIVISGTLLRLILANWGRYLEDSLVLGFRAERLAKLPISDLYKTNQGVIGHLPGDLWLLWYISNLFHVLSPTGDFYGDTFLYVTKLVPILGDAGIMCLLFLIARDLVNSKAGLVAAGLYAISPGPIVIASLWDQWDSISSCAFLLAFWLFFRWRYELAAAALTYAALVKPQFAVFALLFAVAYAHRHFRPLVMQALNRGSFRSIGRKAAAPLTRAVAVVLAAWVTAEAVLLPFNVSIPPLSAQFDPRDRLRYVFRVHDETTLNAFNLWATPIAANAVNDYEITFAGLTSRTWGQILFGAAVVLVVTLWWRNGSDIGLVWAGLAIVSSSYMLRPSCWLSSWWRSDRASCGLAPW